MIDVNKTLLNAIVTQVNEMRFHANNDPKCWKKIIYLALLDDMYDWSFYREDSVQIQSKLKELRTNFILNNPMFKIFNAPSIKFYTNANVPQNNDTWKKIWDNEDVIEPEIVVKTSDIKLELEYEPDYSCERKLIYLPYLDKIKIDKDTNEIIVEKHLTICEKMNIYLDPENNKAYYLDTTGTWQLLNTNNDLQEEDIKDMIKKYEDKGVKYKIDTDASGNSSLILDTPSEDYDVDVEDDFGTATIPILTDKDNDDLEEML